MFAANCNNPPIFKRYLGERTPKLDKFVCGFLFALLILVIIAGPFLAFSNLSIFANYNLVEDASASLSLKYFDLNE